MDFGGRKLWWGEAFRNCVETSFRLLKFCLFVELSCEMSVTPLYLICVLNKIIISFVYLFVVFECEKLARNKIK